MTQTQITIAYFTTIIVLYALIGAVIMQAVGWWG